MYHKIVSEADWEKITPGRILIQYPINGNDEQNIDLSDMHNFLLFEIIATEGTWIELRISEDDRAYFETLHSNTAVAVQEATTIKLKLSHLTQEHCWWYNID